MVCSCGQKKLDNAIKQTFKLFSQYKTEGQSLIIKRLAVPP